MRVRTREGFAGVTPIGSPERIGRAAAAARHADLNAARRRKPGAAEQNLKRKETRVSAINSALATIDRIGADGEMDANVTVQVSFDLDAVSDPIVLPDGKRIYPPLLFGEPIDEVACKLIDTENPAASRFLRLTGPPGTGKSQVARAIAYRLWRGAAGRSRNGMASRSTG